MKRGSQTVAQPAERAVLVGISHASGREDAAPEGAVEELGQLARTAGVEPVAALHQRVREIRPSSYLGRGKIEEIGAAVQTHGASVVLVDGALSPAQQRTLTERLGCKVLDRSQLILDIFAARARSLEGKLQVELAQLEYLLPRLTRAWTHLSRLGGGVGTRGPGETQLEVDRRRVRERIVRLRRRLDDVGRTRALHRHERGTVPYVTVALVGYTNAGKSTLMNALTQAGVLVADALFATLDSTIRRCDLPRGERILLVDTVGFIRGLPHQLVDAFKGTLEEVRQADLLLHVADASSPEADQQLAVVRRVLAELGAGDTPTILVWNKCDLPIDLPPPVDTHGPEGPVRMSARSGEGVPALLAGIEEWLARERVRVEVAVPSERGDLVAWLHRAGRVVSERYENGTAYITALATPKLAGQLRKRLRELECSTSPTP